MIASKKINIMENDEQNTNIGHSIVGGSSSVAAAKIVAALGEEQLREWRKQREQLRSNYRQLWGTWGGKFREVWETSDASVRLAMVLAARDDAGGGELVDSFVPEAACAVTTAAAQAGLATQEDGDLAADAPGLCELMQLAYDVRDVETGVWSYSAADALADSLETDSARAAARDGLRVGRSCVLLQFASALLLLVTAQDLLAMDPTPPKDF